MSKRVSYILVSVCLFILTSGCVRDGQKSSLNKQWAEPIEVTSRDDGLGYSQYRQYSDNSGKVADIALRYVSGGRDYNFDGKADGYAVIATPILKNFDVTEIQGKAIVRLYRIVNNNNKEEVIEKALLRWDVHPGYLPINWRKTNMLDGYVLRLSWGENAMATGRYLLLIEFEYKDKDVVRNIFREIRFDDLDY
ncbi:MAG: hypothetical protein JEZ07_11520 [Phycisphaerae bacterium]|nr:hypothetical protein [Phycisphaerae bacterium]